MSEHEACRWLIRGRVQGVGFRWFVLRRAEELGVTGWAYNRSDGQVEVVGEGPTEALAQFEKSLRSGPRFSRVENVEKTNIPHEVIDVKSFTIR